MVRPGISTKNTEKIPLGSKVWNAKKIPKKYRENTKNAHFWYFGGIFSVFSGYFGGKFWESRISGRGVFFQYFSWKFRIGPFRGSVAGRGVLNPNSIDPVLPPHIETFIARTACDSRRMRAKLVQKHFRDLRVISPPPTQCFQYTLNKEFRPKYGIPP